ncbi:uncharacterized protein LOC106370044 [Brassica napus]|uniref:uncharacterized protein LOC106370044 n=1 Tax=Brassica napus TaxID=3708 RepID=UPI0006AB28C0|nr:uncharacterized protein LOC106370044 [Brassica napus]
MFGITSRMMLCGEKIRDYDIIEKTLSTFHPENVILQQQYRVNGYTRYSELMQVLLVAEHNNQLVTLNHQTRPTGYAPFPEANVASSNYDNWRGRGRRFRPYDERNNKNFHENERNEKDRDDKRQTGKVCYRCGMKGHWVRSCRTPKHLADLYRESQKGKEKGRGETNFISDEPGPSFHGLNDDTHLDVSDFLVEPESIMLCAGRSSMGATV